MSFLLLSQDEMDIQIARSIKAREQELAAYQFEARSHESAIVDLSQFVWADDIIKFRGMQRDQMIAAAMEDGLTDNEIAMIANVTALEQHRHALQAVKIEMAKSERSYLMLLAQLPEGERRTKAFQSLAE